MPSFSEGVWVYTAAQTAVLASAGTDPSHQPLPPAPNIGLVALSRLDDAVQAICWAAAHAAVSGTNDSGGFGVWARGTPGGYFESPSADAVRAVSRSGTAAGVSAQNDAGGCGVWAKGTPAGQFEGDVVVAGTVTAVDVVLTNGDLAEEFPVAGGADTSPGTVMVLTAEGFLDACTREYDHRVAGVVAGGAGCPPAIIIGHDPHRRDKTRLALLGRVACKVDATRTPVVPGDLLTTSSTPGHAMRADADAALTGRLVGKALRPVPRGTALIPIIACLQ